MSKNIYYNSICFFVCRGGIMFILKKQRVLLMLGFLFFSFSMYFAQNRNLQNRSYDITQVSSIPVTQKVVIIDAGHRSEKTDGAVSSNGIAEADINLKIALKVQNLLEEANATVLLTRSDENAIYEIDSKSLSQKKVSDIKNRVKIGNQSEADIFVSIHLNKIPETQYDGWQTFYNRKSEKRKTSRRSHTKFSKSFD